MSMEPSQPDLGTTEVPIHVVLTQQEGYYYAQGLQWDVGAQGRSVREALEALWATLTEQVTSGSLAKVKKAPSRYWARFDAGFPLQVINPVPIQREGHPSVRVTGHYRIY